MSAVFSECRTWRYTLTREGLIGLNVLKGQPGGPSWTDRRTVAFVGLNPSTADETLDDQTIRKCKSYAKAWGYDRLVMLNIFAFRATNPKKLQHLARLDRVGPNNDLYLVQQAKEADLVVCAWGTHAKLDWRGADVARMLRAEGVTLHALGFTKEGYPKHPLYLRGDLQPVLWDAVGSSHE